MKSISKFLIVLSFALVMALAFAPAVQAQCDPADPTCVPSGDLILPTDSQLLVAALVGFVVTAGLKSFSQVVGKDLSGFGAAITAGIVTAVVAFINSLLSLVPAAAHQPVLFAFALLASVLSAFGIHYTVKGFQKAMAGKLK